MKSTKSKKSTKVSKSKKSSKPLISVVVPCWNDVLRLPRSIKTILGQMDDADAELIIVDDRSTDGSAEFAEALISSCPKAKVIRSKRNAGPGAARNLGASKAKGEYLYFHDADDYLGEKAFVRAKAAIEKYNHPDVVVVPLGTMTDKDKPIQVNEVKSTSVADSAGGPVSPMAQLIKLEKFTPFPEDTLSEDAPWHFLQWDQFETFGKVADDGSTEPFYVWDRTTGKSITDTITFCYNNPSTLEVLAFCDVLPKNKKRDRWVSDFLRNIANMYDVRHLIKNPAVKTAWQARFRNEVINLMTGRYAH